MTNPSLSLETQQSPQNFSVKELQVVTRDTPAVPVEIQPFVGIQYRCSADIYAAFRGLAQMATEAFLIVHLNCKNKAIGMTTVSIGSLSSGFCHPREVFRPAICNPTSALLLIHNHPSGDPNPSVEDIQMTKRLREVGDLVGIKVLDHIVIGTGRYFSFADEGLI